MIALQYHARSYELLGLTPKVDMAAVALLDAFEQRYGVHLPASVREWYALEDAYDILLKHSNADPPIPVAEWRPPLHDTLGGGPHDLLAQGLLPIRYENQAVCVWVVMLNGADDPPVVIDVDTQFTTWLPCADQFSTHVYCWLWDYMFVVRH